MTDAPSPDFSALSADDETRRAELAARVLGHANPTEALLEALEALDLAQKPAVSAALYESVCYRANLREFWVHYRMWKVYRALGPARDDAAFFHAAAAVQMHPDWDGSDQMFRDLFLIFTSRGRDREALDLFHYQAPYHPTLPAGEPKEIRAILARLDPQGSAIAAADATDTAASGLRLHHVLDAEVRPAWTCPAFGGRLHNALRALTEPMPRPAITVAEFEHAELLVYRNAVATLDRAGGVHELYSTAEFPEQVRDAVGRLEQGGTPVELYEVETAVLIGDRHPPNLAHFLLDQITRLALYQKLGVATERALAVGPEPVMAAQREILRMANVGAYLGTDRLARVRARRLWVSSNCRDLWHAAHLGAPWAVGFAQATLRGQGTKGWRRLYLSRADARGRRVANEAELMALLEPLGFERMLAADMSYPAQIAAFKQASHVIGPHGAGLAHIVLCPPGAHVLEIFHPLYGTSGLALQAAATGIRYAAMTARDWESDAPDWNDPDRPGPRGTFTERNMRVDLDVLAGYLATVA